MIKVLRCFISEWFLKNYLNPALQANTKAHEELIAKKASIATASDTKHVAWLKIFYRLGPIFLCMMLVHRFFALGRSFTLTTELGHYKPREDQKKQSGVSIVEMFQNSSHHLWMPGFATTFGGDFHIGRYLRNLS